MNFRPDYLQFIWEDTGKVSKISKHYRSPSYLFFLCKQCESKYPYNTWVSKCVSLSNMVIYMPARAVCCYFFQTVWTQIRPDKMSGLIWIQTVWHWWYSWKKFSKKLILKKNQQTTKCWLICLFFFRVSRHAAVMHPVRLWFVQQWTPRLNDAECGI